MLRLDLEGRFNQDRPVSLVDPVAGSADWDYNTMFASAYAGSEVMNSFPGITIASGGNPWDRAGFSHIAASDKYTFYMLFEYGTAGKARFSARNNSAGTESTLVFTDGAGYFTINNNGFFSKIEIHSGAGNLMHAWFTLDILSAGDNSLAFGPHSSVSGENLHMFAGSFVRGVARREPWDVYS